MGTVIENREAKLQWLKPTKLIVLFIKIFLRIMRSLLPTLYRIMEYLDVFPFRQIIAL